MTALVRLDGPAAWQIAISELVEIERASNRGINPDPQQVSDSLDRVYMACEDPGDDSDPAIVSLDRFQRTFTGEWERQITSTTSNTDFTRSCGR